MRIRSAIAFAASSAAILAACGSRTGLTSGLPVGGSPGTGGLPTETVSSSASESASSTSSASSSSASSTSSSTGAIQPCPMGCAAGTASFPPAVPLQPPNLPANCVDGFEMNNVPGQFTALSISPSGAAGGPLDVEIATYRKPDHVRITGIDASNDEYLLVDLCDLQTATYGDPTNGCTRPPDDSIRQYEVFVQPGTTSLTFDVSGACTPYYLQVLGLCDFFFSPPVAGCGFRVIP